MFGSNKQQLPKQGNGEVDTLIGRNTRIDGDVHFTGGLYVDGQVKGSIATEANGEAMLSISDSCAASKPSTRFSSNSRLRLALMPSAEIRVLPLASVT